MKTKLSKILSLAITLIFVISCVPNLVQATQTESALANLYHVLNDPNQTELTIAYLGGSITNGSNATDLSRYSWRALVGSWFETNYGPGTTYNKTVTNIHGAIGATGSYFGSYRVYDDCGFGNAHKPDVLFIEFAINDIYDKLNTQQYIVNYESIIRHAYKVNPKMTIITLYTMDSNTAKRWVDSGKTDDGTESFTIQRQIADHYGLPKIEIGHSLIDYLQRIPSNALIVLI